MTGLGSIAVTGASGQLGRSFAALIPDALMLSRDDVDLEKVETLVPTLDELDPQILINCAAYTAVDKAEEEEDLATVINGEAVAAMAQWAESKERRFVTFSTDYVFAGTADEPYIESSPTDPINAYGRSKRFGELAALDCTGTLVIRTSWLISGHPPNFVATMLRLASQGRELNVVADQQGCPTIAADLARHTLDAVKAEATGLLHAANAGVTTWYGLAVEAIRNAGLDTSLLSPCTTAEYPTPAARPAYSVLESERSLGIEPMPPWETSLPEVVEQLGSAR